MKVVSNSGPAPAPVPSAAVILAGGRGRRMGGRDKPALRLGDRTLLQIALIAVGAGSIVAGSIVVVGPSRELPAGVRSVVEQPPGGGPAAGLAAGLTALPDLETDALIAVLAADLPGIDRDTVARLCAAASAGPGGAVLVDATGRRQYLTGVWRRSSLSAAIGARVDWTGRPLRELLAAIPIREVQGSPAETADVDTPDDWERWQRESP